jgi:hypothetical protein
MIAVLAGHLQQGRHELLLSEQRTGGHRAHTAGVDGLGHVGSRARQPPSFPSVQKLVKALPALHGHRQP